jgi:hypothetical protein
VTIAKDMVNLISDALYMKNDGLFYKKIANHYYVPTFFLFFLKNSENICLSPKKACG